MPVTTSDAFFDLLEKSQVLDDQQLAKARQQAAGLEEPKDIARRLIKQGLLTTWQASMLVNGKHNLHLGKYRLIEQLDSTEMGQVFLAEHTQMGRRVVLRTLSKLHTRNPQAIKQFLDESRQIAALDHRNLIHVYDVDSEGERYYLVSEYVQGEDLQSRVEKKGPLPPEQAARYIQQAAQGLAHAHQRGVVHGDVKPANLLVDAQDSVRVLDVGVARIAQTSGKSEDDGMSSSFRAPEQAAGQYDHRADIYALGRTLYYLLTGQVALSRNSGADVGLLRICQKMLAKDPEQRTASAEEVAEALAAWSEKPSGDAAAERNGAKRKPPIKPGNPRIAMPLADDVVVTSDSGDGPIGQMAANGSPAVNQKPQPQKAGGTKIASLGNIPLWALIAGGGGLAAIVLIVVVGLLYFFVFSGRSATQSVAQAAPASVAQKAGEPKPFDPEAEFDPERDTTPEPEKASDGLDSSAGSPTAAANEAGVDNPGASEPGGTATSVEPMATALPENPGTAPADPATPMPTPEGAGPAEPMPNTEPPMPAEPKPAEPMPKPAEPMPKPAAPKPAPPQNPFRNLPAVVALPELGTADMPAAGAFEPHALGDLFVKPGELFFLELVGGDSAYKGTRNFALVPNTSTERDWDVVMSRGGMGDLKVAALSAHDDKLFFQWMPEAVGDNASPYFANCILAMRTGLATHSMVLRKPVEVEPLVYDLAKSTAKADLAFEMPPDAAKVMLEIAAVEGMPQHVFDPEQAIPADDETTYVRFGTPPVLSLKVDSKMRKGTRASVQVTLGAYYKLEGMPKDERFVEKQLKNLQQQAALQRQQGGLFLEQLNSRLQTPKLPQAQKALISGQIQQGQAALSQLDSQIKQLEALGGEVASFGTGGKIHFRVYLKLGDQEVDLVRSNSIPAPPPAKGAPAAKGAAPAKAAPAAKK